MSSSSFPRQAFTGYERDDETNLDFAQARYFASNLGRFSSPDPLAASADTLTPQSWNRYSYSFNNPLRYTDPSGMVAGDFHDDNGNKIGTDGIADGKIYFVTDKGERKIIRDSKGPYTGKVHSALELVNYDVRQEIGVAAVANSNAATSTEKGATGGFAETGGVVIPTENGGQLAVPAVQGAMGDPRRGPNTAAAEINVENPADRSLIEKTTDPSSWLTTYHIHPSGEIKNRDGSIAAFQQEPSNFVEKVNGTAQPRGDIPNANNPNATPVTLGYRMVVAAGRASNGGQRVYFYNGTGVLGSMPLNKFVSIH